MQTIRLKPDQWAAIGESLTFAVTDVDADGVRVLLRGQVIGGPEDGADLDRAGEIATGSELKIGLVTLALIDTKRHVTGDTAKLGIYCPPHLAIRFVKEPT